MAELSRDEVAEVLGRVSDAVAAEIIATGIDKAGLVAARDRVVSDRKTHGHHVLVEPGAFGRAGDSRARAGVGELLQSGPGTGGDGGGCREHAARRVRPGSQDSLATGGSGPARRCGNRREAGTTTRRVSYEVMGMTRVGVAAARPVTEA